MKRNAILSSMLLGVLTIVTSCGDDEGLNLDEIPLEIREDFDTRHANSEGVSWEQEGDVWEAEFMENGVEKEIVYDLDFNWIQTECEIPLSDVPNAAVDYINENYSGDTIDEAEAIQRAEGDFVEVEIDDNGQERELLFDEAGNFVEEIIEDDDDDDDDDD